MVNFVVISFLLSIILTFAVQRFAKRFGVLDVPDRERKFHQHPVPLLGGVAVFFSFWLVTGYLLFFHPILGIQLLKTKLVAAFFASLIMLIVGVADDLHPLPARARLLAVGFAILIAIWFGLNLPKITNPLGGTLALPSFVGGLLVFLWLLGMTYTVKITDGLDGLATGVVTIGAFMIYFLSNSGKFYQPNVALLSAVFGAVCLGFLLFNFYPAKIFLGESGSLLLGFILGVLAVISGGKLATALLVMAIPAFDLARVIYIRKKRGQPLFKGDRTHLHFQLLNRFSQRTVVLLYYAVAAALGLLALVFESKEKLLALLAVLIIMLVLGWKWREMIS